MVLGVTRREREALRADKAWTSVWHRQMLNFQRGLTNDKTDAITNGVKTKSNHGDYMNDLLSLPKANQ